MALKARYSGGLGGNGGYRGSVLFPYRERDVGKGQVLRFSHSVNCRSPWLL